jgi:pilus assembly protein CpaE
MADVEADTAATLHVVAEPDSDDDARTRSSEDGEITVVFSAKGGSGKTVVSTNLALALARNGSRTCLVDLDLEFGDVAVCLQLAPARNIADGASLDLTDDASVAALVTTHESKLDCVLAPINPGDAERVPVRVVSQLLAQLRKRYDHVVVDTPSQLSEHVLEAFDAAQHHVLVTTPEIPSLKNTRLTLDMFELLGYTASSRHVVMNRADPKVGLSRSDVQSALSTTIATELPATNEVPKSINTGVPMMLAAPQHQFSVALQEFATRQIANDVVAPKRRRRLLSLGQGRAS